MKIIKQKIPYLLFIGLMSGLFCACNFEPFQGEAQVMLDLGWLTPSDAGQESATRASTVQGAPANIQNHITSIEITISGPGVNTITRTYYEWPRYLSVSVPPGKQRTIGLRINIDPQSESAVLAFGGETTIRYITAGEQEKVQIQIAPVETKLVVPDYSGGTAVQMNSMQPDNQTFKKFTPGSFEPYDIAFDGLGRVYITNQFADSNWNIVVIQDFDSTLLDDIINIIPGFNLMPRVLAADYNERYMYCCSSNQIVRWTFDETDDVGGPNFEGPYLIDNVSNITGIDVDEDGLLYLIATYGIGQVGTRVLLKYNFESGGIVTDPVDVPDNAVDVLIRGNYAFVACRDKIQSYNKNDLTLSFENGIARQDPGIPGEFYGPQRFISMDEDRFYIIDEMNDQDRVVSFNNITGWSGWEILEDFPVELNYSFMFYE
ncbi:MAG: hypothetical protein JW822_14620 [Spirochaetales bacterium]|nr:hypothetical protein [Spirochaetales bacterium]